MEDGNVFGIAKHSFDLNLPCGEFSDRSLVGVAGVDSGESNSDHRIVIPKYCSSTKGGIVKASGDVLRVRTESLERVAWVLGLPKGDRTVPSNFVIEGCVRKVAELEKKYGKGRSGTVVRCKRFAVTPGIVEKLMSKFEDYEAEEFKTLFLMVALDMVLCPTQSSRFPKELLPALSCATDARLYNWCSLVLEKLMASAKRFGDRFCSEGFAGGCGGCTLFVAILHLDRLDRNAIHWGKRPRIKVWTNVKIKKACDDDRVDGKGDFGCAGVLDVAYGEKHPYDARDAYIPPDSSTLVDLNN